MGTSVSEGLRMKGLRFPPYRSLEDCIGQGIDGPCFAWPLLTVDDAALDHNITTAAGVFAAFGAQHAPHAKTHMSAHIWKRQEAAGAWGPTVANPAQLCTVVDWGVTRAYVANEFVDIRDVLWLRSVLEAGIAGQATLREVWLQVDSRAGVEVLAHGLRGASSELISRIGILVELGYLGGRSGVRSVQAAVDLARHVVHSGLRLVGVAGYEGQAAAQADAQGLMAVTSWCQLLLAVRDQIEPWVERLPNGSVGQGPVYISAGGSSFIDVVLETLRPHARTRLMVRSGAYALHDHVHYSHLDPWGRLASHPLVSGGKGADLAMRPAITVWGQVLSVPEPGLAIVGIGKRDISCDLDMPIALWVRTCDPQGVFLAGQARGLEGVQVTQLNDQHTYLSFPVGSPGAAYPEGLSVGDVVGLGISHPCTTMDKWRMALLMSADRVADIYPLDF